MRPVGSTHTSATYPSRLSASRPFAAARDAVVSSRAPPPKRALTSTAGAGLLQAPAATAPPCAPAATTPPCAPRCTASRSSVARRVGSLSCAAAAACIAPSRAPPSARRPSRAAAHAAHRVPPARCVRCPARPRRLARPYGGHTAPRAMTSARLLRQLLVCTHKSTWVGSTNRRRRTSRRRRPPCRHERAVDVAAGAVAALRASQPSGRPSRPLIPNCCSCARQLRAARGSPYEVRRVCARNRRAGSAAQPQPVRASAGHAARSDFTSPDPPGSTPGGRWQWHFAIFFSMSVRVMR